MQNTKTMFCFNEKDFIQSKSTQRYKLRWTFLLLLFLKYTFQVRHQISSIMATALSLDIEYGEDGLNMGNGYPGLSDLLEFIMPKLKINFHNPSLNGHSIRQQNGNAQDHDENSSRYVLFLTFPACF